jgi:hypothetical protein
MSDPQQDNRWHLDKKVPVGIILVLLFQGAAGIWAIADIKKDVELLKDARVEQRERDKAQDKATTDAVNLLRSDIKDVSGKLDRLIERDHKK